MFLSELKPESFYADNRTIFEYRKLSEKNKTIDRDTHIQFKRCCQQLGIEVITTSVAQAKGKIEPLWGSLQSRLISELSLNKITTIEDANAFLPKFTKDFNKRFALKPDPDKSLFVPAPPEEEINYYLSVLYHRKVDQGSSFKFYETKEAVITETQEKESSAKQAKTDKPKWKPAPYHPWRRFVISSNRKR